MNSKKSRPRRRSNSVVTSFRLSVPSNNNLVQQYMSEMQQAAQAQQLAQLNDNASTRPSNWLGALNITLGSYNKSQVAVHQNKAARSQSCFGPIAIKGRVENSRPDQL
jgi:hypothetical protein